MKPSVVTPRVKDLFERLRLARCVLRELSRQPLQRSELTRRAIQRGGSYASFNSILSYLVESGYVEKSGAEHRAPYRVTERGLKFLEVM
jgi:DNA-binding PadR family transcriptional regulator